MEEEQARRSAAERCAELEAELAELREALDARTVAITRLLSGVAHDLNNLSTLAELQVSSEEDAEDLRGSGLLWRVRRVSGTALAFARTDTPRRESLLFADIVESVRGEAVHTLPEGVKLEVDVPGRVRILADRGQLVRALGMLVENAADATEGGGVVELCASANERALNIEVRDRGRGLTTLEARRAFEPFFSTKPKARTAGLGLTVAKAAIDEHGGTLRLVARDGGGTVAQVRLPLAKDSERPPYAGAFSKGKIVVAEDNALLRGTLAASLSTLGHEVVQCEDGNEVTGVATTGDPAALFVLDLELPNKSGLECLRELRASGIDAPIILITGYHPSDVPVAGEDGVHVLTKPFKMADLEHLLRTLLRE